MKTPRGCLGAREDKLAPAAPGGRGAKIPRRHAESEPRVATGAAEDPGDQARSRGLPRRAGDHDAKAVRRQLAPVLGLADETNVVLARRLGFGIAVEHLVALDDEVGLAPARHVPGGVTVGAFV